MTAVTVEDQRFMARALQLAAEGLCSADPNPCVGCVIVRDGKIVGEGFHARAGEAHAEVVALVAAGDLAIGATAYVTLEPCNQHGRKPPCVDALVSARVSRVVYAVNDPNVSVRGGGGRSLASSGIAVSVGCCQSAARLLNVGFFKRVETGRPYVRLKLAASVDGRTALQSGHSRWLTGDAARADVQQLRARSSAILSGFASVQHDDSRLSVRDESIALRGRHPLKVILDPMLQLSVAARVLKSAGATLILTDSGDSDKCKRLVAAGAEVCGINGHSVRELPAVLGELARRHVNELLVESGPRLAGAFIAAGLVDELIVYLAPHLLGDSALPFARLPLLSDLKSRWEFRFVDVRHVGADLRVTLMPQIKEGG